MVHSLPCISLFREFFHAPKAVNIDRRSDYLGTYAHLLRFSPPGFVSIDDTVVVNNKLHA
jgi:hypothetical protein